MFRLARDQRGFTLTELLVVIAILGMMLAGLVTVQTQGQQSYLIGSHRVEAQQNGRIALELMVRELRSAAPVPPAAPVTAIPSATDMSFVDENGNTIRYWLSGAVLNRTVAGVTTPLIGGVQTLTLTYYSDYNGATGTFTTAATASAVKLVRIQLVTGTEEAVASYSASNQQSTLETLVRLRNT